MLRTHPLQHLLSLLQQSLVLHCLGCHLLLQLFEVSKLPVCRGREREVREKEERERKGKERKI